jgi:hypothetical protein
MHIEVVEVEEAPEQGSDEHLSDLESEREFQQLLRTPKHCRRTTST